MLHRLLNEIVLCRSDANHTTDMSCMSIFLTFMGCQHRAVNLGFLILENILYSFQTKGAALPYGMLLTAIFKHFKIPLTDKNLTVLPRADITDVSLKKMGFYTDGNGHWSGKPIDKKKRSVTDGNMENRILVMDARLISLEADVKAMQKQLATIIKLLKRNDQGSSNSDESGES